MATVLPFIRYNFDFDDETTRLMGEAFDAACKGLRTPDSLSSSTRS